MDLRDHLLALLSPRTIGDEILPGALLAGASSELGPRISITLDGNDVQIELAPVELSRPFAARSRRLTFSYLGGGGHAKLSQERGLALCKALAALAETTEDEVLAAIARDAEAARALDGDSYRVREVRIERLLEPSGAYDTISPYVGCLIGCRFCYAQSHVSSVRRLEGLPEIRWGGYVDVRVNAPEVLAHELEARASRPIKFCPIVSDPYQAVEARYRITRGCLEVLAAAPQRPVLLLTRSRAIVEDAGRIAALPLAWAGCSIPTADDEVRRHFEPRGSSIDERLDALAQLRALGVRTFAVVQPLLPGPPGSIDALADGLARAVSSVSIDVLRGVEGATSEFADPRWAMCADPAWQAERAAELARALERRGVALWPGELPPELA